MDEKGKISNQRESEKEYIESLALESEKISEIDTSILNLASKVYFSDIVAWNSEVNSASPARIPPKSRSEKPNHLLSRRKSNSEVDNYTFYQDSSSKNSFLQRKIVNSPEKKLPIIGGKVLIPRMHVIQAPLQKNKALSMTNGFLYDKSHSESPSKIAESDFSQKSIGKKVVYPIDLLKKQELLYDYYPIKPVNKTFEISLDKIQNPIRPRNFSKLGSIL